MSRVQTRPNSFSQENRTKSQLARVARTASTPVLRDVDTAGLTSAQIDAAVLGSSSLSDIPDGLQITDKTNSLLLVRVSGRWGFTSLTLI